VGRKERSVREREGSWEGKRVAGGGLRERDEEKEEYKIREK
jgi:hypothetical protein